jgi:alkylglycerol monooxygenase
MEIAYAVPFFFALILLELLVGRLQHKKRYAFADTVTNLACGIGQQTTGYFLVTAEFGAYVWLQRHVALFHVSRSSVTAWVLVFLGVDLAYYWFHRMSHRVRFIWATHAVHHQSEEYNLSVALRQSWLQQLPEQVFYWPLAVLGFPPEMFGLAFIADTLYQFWIHTRVVGKLGPLEWIFNTPSHHRVHHAINPKYIDKNYAGTLIVWDRMFGTFIAEDEEPAYGTVKPLASFNPLWANVAGWVEIAKLWAGASRVSDKLRAPLAPPEWLPPELGGRAIVPEVSRETQKRYRTPASVGVRRYVFVNFVLVLLATGALGFLGPKLAKAQVGVCTALILFALVVFGGLLEDKRWAKPLEVARLATVVVAAVLWWPSRL